MYAHKVQPIMERIQYVLVDRLRTLVQLRKLRQLAYAEHELGEGLYQERNMRLRNTDGLHVLTQVQVRALLR